MVKERDRLKKEIDEVESIIVEAMAKKLRLGKQLRLVEGRAADSITRELESIEEVERLEREPQAASPSDGLLVFADVVPGPDVLQMSPFSWAAIDQMASDFFMPPVGGTSEEAPGSC